MLKVIEPGKVQKRERLLPGSKERESIKVESLEELKKELEVENKKANKKRKFFIKTVVLSTMASLIYSLIFKPSELESDKKNIYSSIKKILKYLGWGITAFSLIRGFKDSKASKIEIINPGEVKKPDFNIKKEGEKEDTFKDIRSLTVKATLDTLLESNLITEKQLKNRAKAYSFRRPKNVDKRVLKDILKYSKKLK